MRATFVHLDTMGSKVAKLRGAALQAWSSFRADLPPKRRRWREKPTARTVLTALLVAGAYYVGTLIGLSVRFHSSPISPIWPPNAILLVALLLVPMQTWWVYLLAVFGAHMLVELPSGIPLATATGLYLTNSAEAVLGAFLVRRFASGAPWLSSLRQVAVYIACAVIVAPVVTSFADAAVVVLTNWGENYWLSWEMRCISNSLAELTIGPALLLTLTRARGGIRDATRWRWTEAALLAVGLLLVGITVFGGQMTWRGPAPVLVYAVLPLLLWAAVRFGTAGTSLALLSITVMATWSAVLGRGPFSAYSSFEDVIALQVFLIGISMPMLVLAALMLERDETRATLEASETRFRAIADQAPVLIWMSGSDALCTFFNAGWLAFTGRTMEQEWGTGWTAGVHSDDRAWCTKMYLTAFAARQPFEMEYRLRRHDGVYRWLVDRGVPRYAPNGHFEGYVGSAIDITERKRAEEELRASEERYRAVVNNFPHGTVLLFGQDLRHIFADGQGLSALGLSEDAIVGKTLWETFPPQLATALSPRYQAALEGNHAEFDVAHASHTYHMQVLPIPYAGAVAGMAIMQDVTEQRRAEMLAELDLAKTAFFSNVSHEFRTPLTLLLGPAADALTDRDEPLPPRQRERLELIQRGGLRLHKLVNSLLDFSRLEAGRVQATYEPTDVAALTADLASMVRSGVERAGLRLVVETPALSGLSKPVYIDREMWEKIVLNLLSNALKFTFVGSITVAVRTVAHTVGREDERVELEVRDTGTGIPADDLPHLFERFYRVQGAQARTHEGTGIGLELVQEFVRLHGGTVRVTSMLGAGSTFTVTIPTGDAHLPADRCVGRARPHSSSPQSKATRSLDAMAFVHESLAWLPDFEPESKPPQASAPAEPTETQTQTQTQSPIGRATILVADDNADMRTYLGRLLGEHWNTQTAADGAAAVAAARARPPDLVIADVMMSGLDGFALITALRAHPQTMTVPVILLSARAGEEATIEGLRAGADDYLIKPFSARELVARVQTHLELVRVRQEAEARAAQMDAVFEAISDGVLVHDLEGHRLYANRAYRDLLQRQLEIQGHHVEPDILFAAPMEREHYIAISDEVGHAIRQEEWPTERALRGEIVTGEHAVDEFTRGADGTILQVNVSAAPVRNAGGQIVGAVAVFRDVTAHRQLERQVAEQASQLEAVFDAMTDGVFVLDEEGRMTHLNPAMRRLFRLMSGDEVPLTARERAQALDLRDDEGGPLAQEQLPDVRLLRGEVLAGASAQTFLVRALDGEERTISLTGAPLRAADASGSERTVGAVGVFRDITELKRTQSALAEQERLFRTLVENSPDIITRFDSNLRHLYVSPASEAVTGIPVHARLGKTYAELGLPWAVYGPWESPLRTAFATGQPQVFETIYQPEDHPLRVSQVRYIPEFAADGRVESVLGITTDITELKQTGEALRQSEERFSQAFHASPVAMAIISRSTRRILDVNKAETQLTGYTRSELVGAQVGELGLIAPADLDALRDLSRGEEGIYEVSVRFRTKSGEIRSSLASMESIQVGGEECLIVTTRDVTERQEAEEALRQSEERFSKAFHFSPLAMAIMSRTSHRFVDANAALSWLTGYSRKELLGATMADLRLLAPGRPLARQESTRNQHYHEATLRLRTKCGEIRSCLSTTGLIHMGNQECMILSIRDITEHERAEEALRRQERLFRTLVENSPDVIARFDRDLRYLYISPAITRLGPMLPEQYLGKTNQELGWPEALYRPAHRAMEEVFRTGQSQMLVEEDTAVPGGQNARYFRAQFLPEFAEDGTVESVLTMTTEITDLKRAEEALRAASAVAEAARREEERRRREAERREQIAESLRDVLAILNSDREVTKTLEYITRQAGRLLSSDAAAIYTTTDDGAQDASSTSSTSNTSSHISSVWATPATGAGKGSLKLQAAFGLPVANSSKRGQHRLAVGHVAIRKAMGARRPVAVLAPPVLRDAPPMVAREASRSGRAAQPAEPGELPEHIEPAKRAEHVEGSTNPSADYLVVREESLPAPYQALLAIPIITQGQVYGGLLLFYTAPHDFSTDEVALAIAYGDQIALAVANARLQEHIERSAIETERNRLARELHDTVTQEIFTASVLAESIPHVWDHHRAEAEENLRQLHQLTRGALAALRSLLLELRPAVLEQRALPDLLRQLAEAMATRSGVPITLSIADDCPPIPIAVKVACYRIAQEALMNTAKYAQAHNISVRLRCVQSGSAIQLEIQDDGQGFDAGAVPAGHFGIGMMRERARAVGATLHITSRRAQGTRIALKWADGQHMATSDQAHTPVGRTRPGGHAQSQPAV